MWYLRHVRFPSKSNILPCCDVNAQPCAADMYVRYGGNHTPHCTGGAPFERPPCAIPNSFMCYTEHTPRVETDRHCCLLCLPSCGSSIPHPEHTQHKNTKNQPDKKAAEKGKSGEQLLTKKSSERDVEYLILVLLYFILFHFIMFLFLCGWVVSSISPSFCLFESFFFGR